MRSAGYWLIVAAAVTAAIATPGEPALAQRFVSYHCKDGAQFVAAFFPASRNVNLQLDGKALLLPQRISASGARYRKGSISLRIKGQSAKLRRGRTTTICTAG